MISRFCVRYPSQILSAFPLLGLICFGSHKSFLVLGQFDRGCWQLHKAQAWLGVEPLCYCQWSKERGATDPPSASVWCLSEQWLCQCKGLWLARLSDAGNVHSPLLAFALKAKWLWLHGSIHTMLGLLGSELQLLQCLALFFEQGLWFCGTTLALPQQVWQ